MKAKILTALSVVLLLIPIGAWLEEMTRELAAARAYPLLYLYHPARALALTGFVLMFYQFILAARLPVVEAVLPRARLMALHRSLGKIGFLLVLTHGLAMLLFDLLDHGAILFSLEKLLGMIGLFLLSIAVVASWFFKPLQFSYRTWKKMHLLAWGVYPLVFLHALLLGSTVHRAPAVRLLFALLFALYLATLAYRLVTPRKRASPPRER